MAYAADAPIAATDFNTLVGLLHDVFGPGAGNYGYGQIDILRLRVEPGQEITAQAWHDLWEMARRCLLHQTGNYAGFTLQEPKKGEVIRFSEDLAAVIDAVRQNRFTVWKAGMNTEAVQTITRPSRWSGSIDAIIDVDFPSEDTARAFFNRSGSLQMVIQHPSGSSAADTSFRASLTGLERFSLSALTGYGFAANAVGFYALTTSPVMLAEGRIGPVTVRITAAVRNVRGFSGGNGTGLRFVVTLSSASIMESGTRLTVYERSSKAILRSYGDPVLTVPNPF